MGKAQPACKVIIERGLTIPMHNEAQEYFFSIWNSQEEDHYWKMVEKTETRHNHYLLGIPYEIQGGMSFFCELDSNNLRGKPIDDSRRQELHQAAKEWQLLFQLDTDEENLNMMWGDVGMIYFWIRTQDLQNRVFDKTWAILECY